MRSALSIIFVLTFGLLFAQVPNAGFESWETREKLELEGYASVGNVSRTSDATDGNYALRLDNIAATSTFGAITNTVIGTDLEGGQPYDEIPLVMSFDCKYDLAAGDVAKILVIFKLQGNPLGMVDFTLNGNSADTFQHFNYAIQWGTSINPDSVVLVLASTDLENPSVAGDGYVIFDDIVFRTFSTPNDSLINRSFEDWDSKGIEHPTSWYTTDMFIEDEYNLPIALNSVVKADHVQSGFESAFLQNVKVGNDIIPGILLTGSDLSGLQEPSFPVNKRWKYIHALVKYDPDNGESAIITCAMFKQGTYVGTAQILITEATDLNEYTYVSQEINYIGSDIPDSASILVSSGDISDPVGENSKLWIDNLNFADHTATINTPELSFSVFPNPAQDILNVQLTNKTPIKIKIYNTYGKEVMQSDQEQIDISSLSPGVYYLHLSSQGNNGVTKFFKH